MNGQEECGPKKDVASKRRDEWARRDFDVFNREHDKRAERCGVFNRERDKRCGGLSTGSEKRTGR